MGCKSSSATGTKPTPRATFRGTSANRLASLPLAGLGGPHSAYPYSNSARGRPSLDGAWDDSSPRGHGYIIGEAAQSSRRAPTSNMIGLGGDASAVFSDAEGFDSGGRPEGEEVYTDGSVGINESNPVVRSGISSDDVSEVLPDEESDPRFRVQQSGAAPGYHDVEEIIEDADIAGHQEDRQQVEDEEEMLMQEQDALENYCAWDPTLRVPSAGALALAPLAMNNPFLRIRLSASASLGLGMDEKKPAAPVSIAPTPKDGEPSSLVEPEQPGAPNDATIQRSGALQPPAPASPPYLLPTEPSSAVFMFPPSSFELYSTGTLHHRIVANRLSSYGSSEHGMSFCTKCPKCKLCPIHVPMCSATDASHLEFHRHRYSSRGRNDCTLMVGLLGLKRAGLLLNEGVWRPMGTGATPLGSTASPASSSSTSGPASPGKKKGMSPPVAPPRVHLSLQAFHALLWRLGTTISEPLALLILLKLFYAFQTLRWLGVAIDPSRLTGADVILSLGTQFRTSKGEAGGGLGQWLGAGPAAGVTGSKPTNATAEWLAGAIIASSEALAETGAGSTPNTLSEARLRNYLSTGDPQQGEGNMFKSANRGSGLQLDCTHWDLEVQILFSNSSTTPAAAQIQKQRDQEQKAVSNEHCVDETRHPHAHLSSRGDSSGIRTIPHTASGGGIFSSPPSRPARQSPSLVHADGTVGFPLWMLLPSAAALIRPPTAHGHVSSTSTPGFGKPAEASPKPHSFSTHSLPPFLRWDFWEEALQIPNLAAAVLSSKTRASAAHLLLVVCRMYRPPLALKDHQKDVAEEQSVNHSIPAGGLPELYEPMR